MLKVGSILSGSSSFSHDEGGHKMFPFLKKKGKGGGVEMLLSS